MKILVTGANGLLGQALIRQLLEKRYAVVGTGRGAASAMSAREGFVYKDLDITDGPAVQRCILEEKPDVLVHAAAMTQVDQCEQNKQECYQVNVTATRFILDAAKMVGCRFIYLSTDFIFDGSGGPYIENDEPAPVNYYGSTKLVAEKAVMESGLDWAIARTILVYGISPEGGRMNIISWVKQNLEKAMSIRMVTDQVRTPTFVNDLASGIILMIEKKARGIYHLSGEEKMTPYEIALEVATFLGLDKSLIEKSSSDAIRQPAVRPPRTGFNIEKAKKDLGFQPVSFREGLKKIFS